MKQFKLDEEIVKRISKHKKEPNWMLDFRLKALNIFNEKPLPTWGPDLSRIDFDKVIFYADPNVKQTKDWKDIPENIKKVFDTLNVPEQEREFLAGLSTQYDSEVIYKQMKDQYESLGIIFESIDSAVHKYPELVKKYLGKLVPPTDNKFAALNSAVWSGGTLIYVPKYKVLPIPVQTYFRINTPAVGQFERTLIIADKFSSIQYIEGCTAPQYSATNLHAAVVEVFVFEGASVGYGTMQKWSENVQNLVTKRAILSKDARMTWRDFNLGSGLNMKYPASILQGDNSSAELYSLAVSEHNQIMDTGGKMIHIGKNTRSYINSKNIAKDSSVGTFRGLVKITRNADNSYAKVICDGLILSEDARSDAIPIDINNNSSSVLEHEASVSKLSKERLEYLQMRGISEEDAIQFLTFGFIKPITDGMLPEYANELYAILKLYLKDTYASKDKA